MTSDDARDRFCAEIRRRLQSFRDQQTPAPSSVEPWWPFPDSVHKSAPYFHSRRLSQSHGSDVVTGYLASSPMPSLQQKQRQGRSLSAKDIWHDPNKMSESMLAESPETPYQPPARDGPTFPERYIQQLQQVVQQKKKQQPQLRRSRARANLKMTEPAKATKKGTGYEAFDDEAFGKRHIHPHMERRSSLVFQEPRPDEVLIVGDEARKRMEAFRIPNDKPIGPGDKSHSLGEECARRDSGYDSNHGDNEAGGLGSDMSAAIRWGSGVSDYDFAQQQCTW
jgi:hypothetical protein